MTNKTHRVLHFRCLLFTMATRLRGRSENRNEILLEAENSMGRRRSRFAASSQYSEEDRPVKSQGKFGTIAKVAKQL
ncbi:hypothetical protein V1478_009307 [Vespula squamosa]|uniref:Uncharacterized protein n=1 Tax=Vespula squamosa TaxID=30214 RepID=A0ABD2AP93_VESSQ